MLYPPLPTSTFLAYLSIQTMNSPEIVRCASIISYGILVHLHNFLMVSSFCTSWTIFMFPSFSFVAIIGPCHIYRYRVFEIRTRDSLITDKRTRIAIDTASSVILFSTSVKTQPLGNDIASCLRVRLPSKVPFPSPFVILISHPGRVL